MDLVVDANVIFATLIKDGETMRLLLSEQNRYFAPEYLIEEIVEHRTEILNKTKRPVQEFEELITSLKNLISIISKEEYAEYLQQGEGISPDPDDFPYFALALKLKCAIWSNDKKLKSQSVVPIYNTDELLKVF